VWYIILKISEFSTVLSASLPAIRLDSTSAMALVFSDNKGNHAPSTYKTVEAYPLWHGLF